MAFRTATVAVMVLSLWPSLASAESIEDRVAALEKKVTRLERARARLQHELEVLRTSRRRRLRARYSFAPSRRPSTPERVSYQAKTKGRAVLRRSVVSAALSNTAKLGRSARIVPSVKNGKPYGFKLYAVRSTSLYAAAGLKNGDIVLSINGLSIDTPDRALSVYKTIRKAKRVVVHLERRGAIHAQTIIIADK